MSITHCEACGSPDLFFPKDGRVLCCNCGADLTPVPDDLTFLPLPDEDEGEVHYGHCYDCGTSLDAVTVRFNRNSRTAHCVRCSKLE